MDLNQLRLFLIASRSKSFSAAAKAAYSSRQNLTRSIHALEKELGATFFVRKSNGITLTREGEIAAGHVERIFDELDAFKGAFSGTAEPERVVRVVVSLYATFVFPDVKPIVRDGVSVIVSEHQARSCISRVLNGEADIALILCMEREFEGCCSVVVSRSPMMLMCSQDSDLAERSCVDVPDLAGRDVVLLPDSGNLYKKMFESLDSLRMSDVKLREIASIPMMKDEVRNHGSVALVCERFRSSEEFSVVPFCSDVMQWNLYALSSEPLPKDVLGALIESIR